MMTPQQLVRRRDQGVQDDEGGGWLTQRRDFYRFCAPYRDPGYIDTERKGPRRPTEIFDATAVAACFRGAGRLQRSITPDFADWIEIQPGPFVREQKERSRLTLELDQVTKIVRGLLDQGGWSVSGAELFLDLYAGEGGLMILKGDRDQLAKFCAIPPEHMQTIDDASGRTWCWLVKWETEVGQILKQWPQAQLTESLAKKKKAKPEETVELLLTCERLEAGRYAFKVIDPKEKKSIWDETLRTTPFMNPRFFKSPGQRRGGGPALLAMPTIKTVNKTVEFELKAAAFAILGAWMTTDDGVYNPRTSVLSPGGMLKVSRTGGAMGASLQRLPIPENFDLSRIITQDLRIQIREILYDNELPDEAGPVRSPTEIVERLKRLVKDIAGAFGRLHAELIVPMVQRLIDLADQWNLLPGFVNVDGLLVKAQVTSPLAHAQMLEDVEKAVRWLELMGATLGPAEARVFADTDAFGLFLHEKLGVEKALVRDEGERAAMREELRAAAAAAYEAEAAKLAADDLNPQQTLPAQRALAKPERQAA